MHNLASTVNIDVGHGAATYVYSHGVLTRAFVSITKWLRIIDPIHRVRGLAFWYCSLIIDASCHLPDSSSRTVANVSTILANLEVFGDAALRLCTRDCLELGK
jgi:hypothetical protein